MIKPKMKKRILLLNPPGDAAYLRDYYCSKTSKADYIYHPVDLLILSGRFSPKKYDLYVLDALVEKWSIEKTIKFIQMLNPEIVISLVGSVCFKQDLNLLRRIKDFNENIKIIVSGDLFMGGEKEILKKFDFIDAAILDFTTDDTIKYIEGKPFKNMMYRQGKNVYINKIIRSKYQIFEIPIPRHDKFPTNLYKYPFVKSPFVTVLTDYGCPFNCSFCIMPKLGFKQRAIKNVIRELKYIKGLGIKNIYFDDQTFGADRKRAIKLCKQIIANHLFFEWVCFSRVDVVNKELLTFMIKAGCKLIMFGVESGSQEILDRHRKGITKDQIRKTFRLCKEMGIEVVGTFILGLPGDTKETCLETIRFAKELDCDYASFNIPVPRMGTDLRKEAIRQHLTNPGLKEMDQSGLKSIMKTEVLSKKDVRAIQKKAIREFYFRPEYIFKRVKRGGFKTLVLGGVSVLKNYLKK